MTSQPTGPASSAPTCRRGRPWKRSASLRPTDLLSTTASVAIASRPVDQPLIEVQAWTQSL